MKKLFRKGFSIHSYLTYIFVLLILLQGGLLLFVLYLTDFYGRVDQQSVDMFYTRSENQVEMVNEQFAFIVRDVVATSRIISTEFIVDSALQEEQLSEAEITSSAYQESHVVAAEELLDLLEECYIDGAFYIIQNEDGSDIVSVNIQNIYPELEGNGYAAYELLWGTSEVSKTYGLGINTMWQVKIDSDELLKDYYTMPLWAVEESPYGSLEEYGYWSIPDSEDDNGCILYTVPLLDEKGDAYGVVGVQISESYFLDNYVERDDYIYEDSFYAIANVTDNTVRISEYLPNTNDVEQFINQELIETIVNIEGHDFYTMSSEGSRVFIVKVDSLAMYSDTSVFAEEELSYLTIVSSDQLYQYSYEIKDMFYVALALTTLAGILISTLLGAFSTRKVKGLSKFVKNLSPSDNLEFPKTYLQEVDELTDAIQKLNEKIANQSQNINRLFDLTDLNIGAYEIEYHDEQVYVTEYIYQLLSLPIQESIRLTEWKVYYARLTEELVDKEKNVYLYWFRGEKRYLKVIQGPSKYGVIGTVLDITKEIEEVMAAKYQLDYDTLTNLYSRAAFYRKVEELMKNEPTKVGALLFVDLDNLKYVNDTYGHDYGDLYLTTASEVFRKIANGNGVAARMSGDEFAIYLHGYDSRDEVREIIKERVEHLSGISIELPDRSKQRVRFSGGISWFRDDADNVSDLLRYADFAMYEAKHTTKGSIHEFDASEYEEKVYMMENREAINQLIEEKSVRFMFQPIVNLHTGEIYAYEALMRSEHPMFKSPLEILKVAASQFKLNKLENMLLCKAIETAYDRRHEIGNAKIYINSIASQMMPIGIYEDLKEKYGTFLNQVVIEITEAEDNTPEKMLQKIGAIREFGMGLAIDDYGSGYSNELRIVAINPEVIKIDMELLQGINKDKDKQLLCANIIGYSHSKGIKIIAEGIEEIEDLQTVMELGADFVQGYYLFRPSYGIQKMDSAQKAEILHLQTELKGI